MLVADTTRISDAALVLVLSATILELVRVSPDFWAWRTESGDWLIVAPARC